MTDSERERKSAREHCIPNECVCVCAYCSKNIKLSELAGFCVCVSMRVLFLVRLTAPNRTAMEL